MAKENNFEDNPMLKVLVSNQLRIFLQLMSVLAVLANLWLFSQLAPIIKDLALVSQRVAALESIKNSDTTVANTVRISILEQQYGRIEEKLDRAINNN